MKLHQYLYGMVKHHKKKEEIEKEERKKKKINRKVLFNERKL